MFLLFLFFFLILIVSGSSDQLIEAKILNSGGNSILETHSNSADYFIRQGKVDELPMIVNLRTSIFFPQEVNNTERFDRIFQKLSNRTTYGTIFFCAFNSLTLQMIGLVEINSFDFQLTHASHPFGADKKLYLGDLGVIVNFRMKGLGSALLKKIDSYAIENQFEEIYLHISDEKLAYFYRKNGYELVPRSKNLDAFTVALLPWQANSLDKLFIMKKGFSFLPLASSSQPQ